MNDSKSELRTVLKALKCMVFSSKEDQSIVALNKDYEQLYGYKIPYSKLGFNSIDDLINKIPSVKLYEKDNKKYVKPDGDGSPVYNKYNSRDKFRPSDKPKTLEKPVRKPNIPMQKVNFGKNIIKPKTVDEKKDICGQESPLSNNSSANSTSPTSNSRGKLSDRLIIKPIFNETRDYTEQQTPKTPTTPTASTSEQLQQDPRVELANFIKRLNLPDPEYKNYKNKSKDCPTASIYCNVSIGPRNKWNSYPQEATSNEEAEKLAATQALLALHKLHGPLVQLRVTTDKELIKQRIIAIVDVHSNGIIIEQLPAYYKDKHNETLPDNWVDIVKQCEDELAVIRGVGEIWILEKATPLNKKLNKEKKEESCAKLATKDNLNLSPLIPPKDNFWPIYVTNIINSNEIWGIIIGENYSDKAHQMSTEMKKPGCEPKVPASNIQRNKYYVIKEDEYWHRVRVDDFDMKSNKVDIFFIDYGDYDSVNSKRLYPLDKHFYNIPPQAVTFSLFELEELANFQSVTNIIESLLFNKRFYCKIILQKLMNNNLTANGIFYDTTTGDDDININELIIEKLGFTLLNNVGQLFGVFISHVNVNGDVYLHRENENLKILAKLINKLKFKLFKNNNNNNYHDINLSKNEIYLVQCPDGNWMRSIIIDILPKNQLKVLLIDYGNNIIINKNKLINLREISPLLVKFPRQAHKVLLHNIKKSDFNEKLINRLIELSPLSEQLVCKLIKIHKNQLPIVELFKRQQPNGELISINQTLIMDPEINNINEDIGNNNNTVKPKKTISINNGNEVDTNETLKRPKLPEKGQPFGVKMCNLIANPSNFIMQMSDNETQLTNMMNELQNSCNTEPISPPLDFIRKSKLCAAKRDDRWYRASINGIIDSQNVVVYLCDYGEMLLVSTDKLQVLKKQFLQLPYQALKAKLHGIEPNHKDWSPLSCKRYQELVAEKKLTAIIRKMEKDDTSPTQLILSVELIDKNIKIHEILVNEKRAVYNFAR